MQVILVETDVTYQRRAMVFSVSASDRLCGVCITQPRTIFSV